VCSIAAPAGTVTVRLRAGSRNLGRRRIADAQFFGNRSEA
jgi:hypothetical protein